MNAERAAEGHMIDTEAYRELARRGDWASIHAMLDEARAKAVSRDDARREVHWRVAALQQQGRFDEALDLLRSKAVLYNSKCYVRHMSACLLLALGREPEAVDELRNAPFDAEMTSSYGLAIDAKFFYFYLLAKRGEHGVADRLSEIPEDYEYIVRGGGLLTRSDIAAEANRI